MTISVSIVGASGYTGGELLRLLLAHPEVEVKQATSTKYANRYVYSVHPNLRKSTTLRFVTPDTIEECDVLFLALPHGRSMEKIATYAGLGNKIIDLSADFRLRDTATYEQWYGREHAAPKFLKDFVYGIPELHREEMKDAQFVSSAGCLATCTILSLMPLFKHDLVELQGIVVDGKVGSSAAGAGYSLATHHPERSHTVRSFAPTGHRHTAEMIQELGFTGDPEISFAPHAIELVRGILTTGYLTLKEDLDEKDLWKAYRTEYEDEPFMRIVKEARGVYRFPEPKILTGTNYCDVGFQKDRRSRRVVVLGAIDNLMKGAAGQAVQALNIMQGFDETTGLTFQGLHPI